MSDAMTLDPAPALDYLERAEAIVRRVRETQIDAIVRAAQICADSNAAGGLIIATI